MIYIAAGQLTSTCPGDSRGQEGRGRLGDLSPSPLPWEGTGQPQPWPATQSNPAGATP